MPEQKRSSRAKGVPHHPLVEALASDPSRPPRQSTRLFGYPGPAADPKSTRLWLDAGLTSYVDVPDEAILHHHTLDNDAGTILWVDPEATLTRSAPHEQEVQAEFLGGAIAQRNLAGAPGRAAGAIRQAQQPRTAQFPCTTDSLFWFECFEFQSPVWEGTINPSWSPDCEEEVVGPVTVDPPCITHSFPCNSYYPCISIGCEPPVSRLRACVSRTLPCISRIPCQVEEAATDPVGPFRPRRR
jgi:hypothetical protein